MSNNRKRRIKRRRRRRIYPARLIAVLLSIALVVLAVLLLTGRLQIGGNPSSNTGSLSSLPSQSSASSSVPPTLNEAATYFEDNWQLRYIGSSYPLPEDYNTAYVSVGQFSVDKRIAPDLKAMLKAAKDAGYDITIAGGYRSPERSQELYDKKVKDLQSQGYDTKDAKITAAQYVALPYQSEHNAGIAVDLNFPEAASATGDNVDYSVFPSYQWMEAHCAEYGFILRYPTNKSNLTGAVYEPWHFRYVGKTHAEIIMRDNLCLEEYIQNLYGFIKSSQK